MCALRLHLPLQASGRTDAGVHAHQQFVQFYLDKTIAAPEAVPQQLNRLLPDDLRVRHLCQVSPQFSVRLHATSREYRYNLAWGHVPDPLKRRYQHFVYGDMDVPAMIGALELMVGTWDFGSFSNFRRDGASTVRTVTKARMVMAGPQEAQIEIQGNGFLHKMVRHIVGAVIAVGRGKITQEHLEDLLKQGVPSHIQAGGFRGWYVADACGLHKVNVEFKEGSMDI